METNRMKLSDKTVADLSLPEGKSELIVFDDDLPGFGVRLRAGGKRTWVVQYRLGRKQRRKTIGSVTPAMNAAKARKAADNDLARVKLGGDPQAAKLEQRAKSADTFDVFAAQFLARQKERLKPRSYVQVAAHLSKHWADLKGVSIHEITKRAIAARLVKIAEERGDIAANRARATLTTFFSWAIKSGIVDANPALGTPLQGDERAREHVIGKDVGGVKGQDDDFALADIWRACLDDDFGRAVKLLILTAVRRDEAGGMLRTELNLSTRMWHVGEERTKNKQAHDVPLSDSAISIIESAMAQEGRASRVVVFGHGARAHGAPDRGFSGWGKAKRELDERIAQARQAAGRAPIDPWRLHDLRRTASTGMAELGVQPHIVEELLGHKGGHKAGVAGIYNRASYSAEKRQALDRWAAHVEALVAGQASNVVTMRRA
jgi:integrase